MKNTSPTSDTQPWYLNSRRDENMKNTSPTLDPIMASIMALGLFVIFLFLLDSVLFVVWGTRVADITYSIISRNSDAFGPYWLWFHAISLVYLFWWLLTNRAKRESFRVISLVLSLMIRGEIASSSYDVIYLQLFEWWSWFSIFFHGHFHWVRIPSQPQFLISFSFDLCSQVRILAKHLIFECIIIFQIQIVCTYFQFSIIFPNMFQIKQKNQIIEILKKKTQKWSRIIEEK